VRWALLVLIVTPVATALAQGSGASPSATQMSRAIGVVTQLQSDRLTLHTDAGADVLVLLSGTPSVLRVPPGAKDLNAAAKIQASDIRSGDRVLVRGRSSEDQKSITAAAIVVMTSGDLANAREAERLDWQRRGISGTVASINPESKELTLSLPAVNASNASASGSLTIGLVTNAVLLRYARDSVKFGDAKPSAFEQIRVGDQVRALGTRSEDGAHFRAEKIVSGTFRTFGANIISPDAGPASITVKDLASGQIIQVRTNSDTRLHRLPAELARSLADTSSGKTPADLQQKIEGTPTLALADLRSGDPVIVVSMEGASASDIMATLVLAGVEPILTASPKNSNRSLPSSWNLGTGAEGGP
jgi:hypothetical protein